ncbi:MAG TPA: hypothetical protein VKG63_10370 [Steroidobacteraceae bacterium]|nr:hypothetical protein [Steroidobacteraceae bacterium]
MKIIAYDHFKSGVVKESITPDLLKEEMTHVWRLQKDGVIREIYGRADAPGAVIVFECGTVEEVKDHVSSFPLSKAGFLEWKFLPLIAPFHFEILFTPTETQCQTVTQSVMGCDSTDAEYEALVARGHRADT